LGYLNRIRVRRPEAYADLMLLRGRQLSRRYVADCEKPGVLLTTHPLLRFVAVCRDR
jgi:hypothetical protein